MYDIVFSCNLSQFLIPIVFKKDMYCNDVNKLVHQFFCILHFCRTCSLCHVELVVQFPPRGSTQVLLCLFSGVLWLWHFLYSVGPHHVSSLHIYNFVVARAFMAGADSQAGDADSSRAPGLTSVMYLVCRGPCMSTVVLYCWCHSDSASVLLYFTLIMARNIRRKCDKQYVEINKLFLVM